MTDQKFKADVPVPTQYVRSVEYAEARDFLYLMELPALDVADARLLRDYLNAVLPEPK